jgi:hypothetical protein
MLGFEFLKELLDRPHPALSRILQTLPDAFPGVGASGNVEQALVSFRILNYRCGFPIHGEDHGTLALLDLLQEIAGPPAECGQGLNVVGKIEHGSSFL